MDDEVYWYYLNGKLKQHLNPPSDPSSVTFAIIKTTDLGYKKVQAEVILSFEGIYQKPKIFTSATYYTPKQFRDLVETYVKQSLTDHRSITSWTNSRKHNNNNIKLKRHINKKCKCY